MIIGIACVVGAGVISADAQDRGEQRFSCASMHGERAVCQTAVSPGTEVRLTRQTGRTQCVEGYSWGTENGLIWVDHGCRAEFTLMPREWREEDRVTRIEPGTVIPIRTNETIRANRVDGRIFTGVAAENVMGSDGHLAIPRGSSVELIVRVASDRDLIIDLESVVVNGRRYAVDATANRIESNNGGGNRRTGEYLGGGAVLGAIIGAIAGGGKGAAIGAGAGAAGGAVGLIVTKGRDLRIPPESIVTFRIERPLVMDRADGGRQNGGRHYHR